ncbi:MAG TPA: helix-turn-helix transcriptional regulator [Bdellovibrionota bacterium]|nr:helix-turn-helix transcriptional regulator [Bdellovibrionota bacterium]
MLAFEGHIHKDGKFWLVEIPGLNLMTQGRSKTEAYKMARSVVIDASGNGRLKLHLGKGPSNTFLILSEDTDTLIPLLLKKQRQKANLTVMEASKRLGSNSPNAYGVYEYGRAKPTLKKLEQLLSAVNPEHHVTLKCA